MKSYQITLEPSDVESIFGLVSSVALLCRHFLAFSKKSLISYIPFFYPYYRLTGILKIIGYIGFIVDTFREHTWSIFF